MAVPLKWSDLCLTREVGSGQAGTVWVAKLKRAYLRLEKDSQVAVKLFRPWVLEQPGQYERIYRELETGRHVVHPNLVRTLGLVADERSLPALVMEYYDGESLQEYLARNREAGDPIDFDKALDIVAGVAGALKALHDNGIIHRDVKPGNIMLTPSGPILMDLGVVATEHSAEMTTSGIFLGTIRYGSPEYLFGETYDFKVDIYSLGASLYELVTGLEFIAEKNQWARMIARKRIEIEWSWNQDLREALESRVGLNCVEFFRTALDHSLTDSSSRDLDLGDFATAISEKYWRREFHFADGKFHSASPMFEPLGSFENSERTVSIQEIVKELKLNLSHRDVVILRRILHKNYWSDFWITPGGLAYGSLRKAGVFGRSEYDTQGVEFIEFHSAVKYAYQNGLL